MRHVLSWGLWVLVSVFFSGCVSQGAAETALNAAQNAVDGIRSAAKVSVPEQLASLDSAIAAAKQKLATSDYSAAVSAVKGMSDKAAEVASSAATKAKELTAVFAHLSESVPKMLDAIKSKVDEVGKTKNLPTGMDRAKWTEIQNGYSEAMKWWADAGDAFRTGDLVRGVSIGTAARNQVTGLVLSLEIKP